LSATFITLTSLLVLVAVPAAFFLAVQPVWCLIDCAVSRQRGGVNKAVWIVVLVFLWSVAGTIYGVFSAQGRALRWLTVLSLLALIGLLVLAVLGAFMAPGYSDWMRERMREMPSGPWV
jgi:hypothetical protein